MEIDVVELTARLMEIDSTSNREGDLMDWVAAFLGERDWRVTRIPVSPGRDDVFATCSDRPLLTLSTHLDTVPPFIPPTIAGGRLLGRGSCDAKGIAASMILAAERLRERQIPVALLFVVGEEITHDGAHAANEFPTTSRILINGEPTESTLARGTKGAVRVTVTTKGQAAHSAYPHLGHSATRDLVMLLSEMETLTLPYDDVLGETTINIGSLAGGVADNVVAPWAEAKLMTRLVTPASEFMEIFERWAKGRATLEWGPMVPPMKLGVVPGFETSIAAFATDVPVLTNWGRPYLFGPGSIHVAHRDDEFVDIEELRQAVGSYERLALAALEDVGLLRA